MDRYQKVQKVKGDRSAISENELRVTAQGRMRNYMTYALSLLQDKGSDDIVLKATGRAISKTVMIAELLKRRVIGLHQNTTIGSVDITDTWEPLEEGLLPLETTRHVSVITISLSKKGLDSSSKGYQAPIPADQVKPLADFDDERENLKDTMRGRHDGEDDVKWSDRNEEIFLTILHERVKKDPNGVLIFNGTDWHEIDEEMFLASGERYGGMKLQSECNRLRVKHWQFSELLEHTRVTYLSSLNTVNAPEDVWQMFFMKNRSYMAFRKKGCPNYELLGLVFNRSTATGHLHHSSSQLPQIFNEERQNEEEFLHHGIHVSRGDGIEGEKSGAGSSKGKHSVGGNVPGSRCVRRGSSEKWDACMDQFASSQSAKAEYFAAKAQKYKGEKSEVTSPLRDADSVIVCMDALEEIDDVLDASYNKALVQFENPYWRKVFMKMSIQRRKSWLMSLE